MKRILYTVLFILLPLATKGSDERKRIGTAQAKQQNPKPASDSTTLMTRGGGAKKLTSTLSPISQTSDEMITLEEELEALSLKKRIELLSVLIKNPVERQTAIVSLLSQESYLAGWHFVESTLKQHEDRGAWRSSYSRALAGEMKTDQFRTALLPFLVNASQTPQQQAAARTAHMKTRLDILQRVTTALNESTGKAEQVVIDFNTTVLQSLKTAKDELQKQQWYTHHNLNTFLQLAGNGSLPEDYRNTVAERQKNLRRSLGDTLRKCTTFTAKQAANSVLIAHAATPQLQVSKKTLHGFTLASLTASLKRKQEQKTIAAAAAQEQLERATVQSVANAAEGTTSITTTTDSAKQ